MVMPAMLLPCAMAGTALMISDVDRRIAMNFTRATFGSMVHPRTIAEGAFRRSLTIAVLARARVAAAARAAGASAILLRFRFLASLHLASPFCIAPSERI